MVDIKRPVAGAFFDLSDKTQVSNGLAQCTGIALCDAMGKPCSSFQQGDWAIFYYEFKLAEKIDVPICGVVIKNDRGIIVHGKNGLQYEDDVLLAEEGGWVICRQEIKLDIAPGEYIFEIGLASVSNETWKRREFISYEAMPMLINRKCHLADVGSFSITLAVKDNISVLRHHGIADLPGRMSVRTCADPMN